MLPTDDDPIVQQAFRSSTIQEFINHGMSLAHPSFGFPLSDGYTYTYYSPQWVGRMADRAARIYHAQGVPVRDRKDTTIVTGLRISPVIESVISFLALSRMGHIILVIGNKMPADTLEAFAEKSECRLIVNGLGGANYTTVPLATLEHLSQVECSDSDDEKQARSQIVPDDDEPAIILHSSGTTGVPKTIEKSHRSLLEMIRGSSAALLVTDVFIGSWMHWLGGLAMMICTFIKSSNRTCWPSEDYGSSPAELIKRILMETKPQTISCNSPFLLPATETPEGLEALKRCGLVVNLGGTLPPYIADRLTSAGVRLATGYGMTELPLGLSSVSSAGDPLYWDYLELSPKVAPHLHFRPLRAEEYSINSSGQQVFELVALPTLPGLGKEWANAPDGSLLTGDLFIKHPTKDLYRCMGRMMDELRVMPNNTDEITITARIYEDFIETRHPKLVDTVVIFGDMRERPGVLLFVNLPASVISDGDIIDAVWGTIESELQVLVSSGLTKNMLVVIRDATVPRTLKGEVVRAQVFLEFSHFIDSAYRRVLN